MATALDTKVIGSVLVNSFPSLSQVAPSVEGIPFQYFNETPSHVVKNGLAIPQFTALVNDLSSTHGLADDMKRSILDAQYTAVSAEVIREFKFIRGGPGTVTYGRIATMKKPDGTIDCAHAIHKVNFELQPEIIVHKKKKRFAGVVVKVKKRTERHPLSLSEADQNRLYSYTQYKALTGFKTTQAIL